MTDEDLLQQLQHHAEAYNPFVCIESYCNDYCRLDAAFWGSFLAEYDRQSYHRRCVMSAAASSNDPPSASHAASDLAAPFTQLQSAVSIATI